MAALTEAEVKDCAENPQKLETLLKGKDVKEVGAAVTAILKAVATSGASDRVVNSRIALVTTYAITLAKDSSPAILPAMVKAAGKYEVVVVAATTVAANRVCTDPKPSILAAANAATNKAAAQAAAKDPEKLLGKLVVWKIEKICVTVAGPPKPPVASKSTATTTTTTQPKSPTPVGKQ